MKPLPPLAIPLGLLALLALLAAARTCRPSTSPVTRPPTPTSQIPEVSPTPPTAPASSATSEVGRLAATPPPSPIPPAEAVPAREPGAAPAGSLHGVIRLAGPLPRPDESLELGERMGLRNAVVYVLRLEAVGPPPPAVGIALRDGRFQPRVVGLLPLQSLEIRNEDDRRHDVLRGDAEAFPMEPGTRTSMRCSGPRGPFRLACRGHAGEVGWAVVLPNPWFAVTDADGAFRIEGIPPGEQTLAIWHERFPQPAYRTVSIEVPTSPAVEIVLPVPR